MDIRSIRAQAERLQIKLTGLFVIALRNRLTSLLAQAFNTFNTHSLRPSFSGRGESTGAFASTHSMEDYTLLRATASTGILADVLASSGNGLFSRMTRLPRSEL